MSQPARIAGKVEYREGDGANLTIPLGPCQIDVTPADATISWSEGDAHGAAAIPIADFQRYLASHALQLEATPTQPALP